MKRTIFITGGTGYIGSRLIPRLLSRGHTVCAIVRKGSEKKLPAGCDVITGDVLDANSYAGKISPSDTFVHLVGVPHPSPSKGEEFKKIDFGSITEAVKAMKGSTIANVVYLSVANPSPVMEVYVNVRIEGERLVRETGLNASLMRPFYVLGPGHWWPYLILPLYWFFMTIPSKRDAAVRLYPVTIKQMLAAMVEAIENPPKGVEVWDAERIRTIHDHAR